MVTIEKCVLLCLSIEDLDRMKNEYPEHHRELFCESEEDLRDTIQAKWEAVK